MTLPPFFFISISVFYVKRSISGESEVKLLGRDLEEFLRLVNEKNLGKNLITYVKSRAIPLIIRLSLAKVPEKEEGE